MRNRPMKNPAVVAAVFGLSVFFSSAGAQEARDAAPAAPTPPPKDPIREAYEAHAPTPALPFPTVEDLKPIPDPDPLVFMDGRTVKTKEDWEARKKEILDLAHHYIYGFCGPEQILPGSPPPEVVKEVPDACGGLATRREIKVSLCPDPAHAQDVMWLSLIIPIKGKGPFPTVLQFDRPREGDPLSVYAIERGYAIAGFTAQQGLSMYRYYFPIHSGPWVSGKDPRFSAHPSGNVRKMGNRPLHGCGERVAWAWRMRRMMDALAVQKEVDAKRVIFVGGSRGGQSVLLAAALDDRAAMVFCWQGIPRIRQYNWPDRPEWFAPAVQLFEEKLNRLPVDLYCVAATLAPRPVLFSADRASSYGNYDAIKFAYPYIASAYRFLGAEVELKKDPGPGNSGIYSKGPLGLHVRDGGHAWVLDDFKAMLDFADEHLKAKKDPLTEERKQP
jgi:hypothetical protein